jgi:hypothetical protein
LHHGHPLQRGYPRFHRGKPALQRRKAQLQVANLGAHRHDAVAEPFQIDLLAAHHITWKR